MHLIAVPVLPSCFLIPVRVRYQLCFFFQAEDGIRGHCVTGVQTCALPIYADAICSAIAYAAFKELRGEHGYVAARCGNSNARIDTILQRFHQPLPLYLSDVSPRVRDLMVADVVSVSANATCAEALELIDRHDIRILPVTDARNHVVGTISLPHLGGIFIPRVSEPLLMRQVNTSLAHIARALRARVLHFSDEHKPEQLYVRLGTMDIRSFWKISERENIPAPQ